MSVVVSVDWMLDMAVDFLTAIFLVLSLDLALGILFADEIGELWELG